MLPQTVNKTALLSGESLKKESEGMYIARFRLSLDQKETTKDAYCDAVKQFFSWVRNTGRELNSLDSDDIVAYKEHLLNDPKPTDGKPHTSQTVATYLVALKRFYSWTQGKKIYANICESISLPKIDKQFVKMPLSLDQSAQLLDIAEERSARDFTLIYLMLNTGLRTVETVRLNREDISTEHATGKHILWIHGKGREKGNKEDVVLSPETFRILMEYIAGTDEEATADEDGTPVFISEGCLENQKGRRLTPRRVQSICKETMRAIGLDSHEYSAHSLRHTFAVNRIRERKASMEDTKLALRHKSIDVTHFYTHTIEKLEYYENAEKYFLDELYQKNRKKNIPNTSQ